MDPGEVTAAMIAKGLDPSDKLALQGKRWLMKKAIMDSILQADGLRPATPAVNTACAANTASVGPATPSFNQSSPVAIVGLKQVLVRNDTRHMIKLARNTRVGTLTEIGFQNAYAVTSSFAEVAELA